MSSLDQYAPLAKLDLPHTDPETRILNKYKEIDPCKLFWLELNGDNLKTEAKDYTQYG